MTIGAAPAKADDEVVVLATTPQTGVVDTPLGQISVWQGNVPTLISMEPGYSGAPCEYIEIEFNALLPYDQLDVLNGPRMEFELRSSRGKVLADRSFYRSSWNPIGSQNVLEMLLCGEGDESYGDHTLIIKTQYQVATTGLISRYYESTITQPLTIIKPTEAPGTPSLKTSLTSKEIKLTISKSRSGGETKSYQIGISTLKKAGLSPSKTSNFSSKVIIKTSNSSKPKLTLQEVANTISAQGWDPKQTFLITVRAVGDYGVLSGWSNGLYFEKLKLPAAKLPKCDLDSAEYTVSVKRSSDSKARIAAKDIIGVGKVAFFLNGKEVGWINPTSTSDKKLRKSGDSYVFAKTVSLKSGKNVIEIRVGECIAKRTTYTR